MSFNSFGFGLDEDDRNPFERDFFDLSDTVGVDGKNNPQDVIKAEIILGNLGDLDLDRTDGPTSLWGQPQEEALRKYQQRNYLKIDGYMKPRGPTIGLMRKQADKLLGGFNAPTPREVIKHHQTLNDGEPILSLKHPPIKLKPIADLPALEDGAAFHTQRSADYLETIYDLGDWPRWTAQEIKDNGPTAIASTRDVLDRLKQKNADQAAKVARAVVDQLPADLKTAFVGGPVPPALPRWVRSNEIMNRIVRLQAERDHGFDMGDDDAPKSMAEMETRKPRETLDLRSDDPVPPPMTMECTPEKCPPGGGRTLELKRDDDPEAEMRRERAERLERKRAESRANRNMAEAADGGGEAPASEPPVTEAPERESPLLSEEQLAQLQEKETKDPDRRGAPPGGAHPLAAKPVAKDVTLEFDGKELRLIRDGKIERTWPAVSGRPGFQNPSDQDKKNQGPIPEGEWVLRQGQHQKTSDLSQTERNWSALGKGKWPGLEDTWGTQRIWLEPSSGTDTKGRNDFSIHGGRVPGSAGCIDLTRHMKDFGDQFRGMGQDVRLIVRYPKESGR